jgi:hypothetical protein
MRMRVEPELRRVGLEVTDDGGRRRLPERPVGCGNCDSCGDRSEHQRRGQHAETKPALSSGDPAHGRFAKLRAERDDGISRGFTPNRRIRMACSPRDTRARMSCSLVPLAAASSS